MKPAWLLTLTARIHWMRTAHAEFSSAAVTTAYHAYLRSEVCERGRATAAGHAVSSRLPGNLAAVRVRPW